MRKITLAFCLAALSCLFVVSPGFGGTGSLFAIPGDPPQEEEDPGDGHSTDPGLAKGDDGSGDDYYPKSGLVNQDPAITTTICDGFLRLTFKKTLSCKVVIKNSEGKVVHSQSLSAAANSIAIISTANLSSGTHVISFSNRVGVVLIEGKFQLIK